MERLTVLVGLRVESPAKLMTVNAERRLHHAVRGPVVAQWRWAGRQAALAEHLPRFVTAVISWHVFQQRGRLADTCAHLPVFKAILDGLVDAGVFPEDTGDVIGEQRFHAPQKGPDGVELVIEGERA